MTPAEDLDAIRGALELIAEEAQPVSRLVRRAVGHCDVFLAALAFAEGHEQPPLADPEPVAAAARLAAWRAGQIEHPEQHARRLGQLRERLEVALVTR